MTTSTTPKSVSSQRGNKIKKIQSIYGQEKSKVTLKDASKHLSSIGFKSLGDLLQSSK